MGPHRIGAALGLVLLAACATSRSAIDRGDDLAARGMWRGALAAYEEAATRRGDDPAIRSRLQSARASYAAQLGSEITRALRAGSVQQADALLTRARELDPESPVLGTRTVEVASAWLARSEEALIAADPRGAFAAADRAYVLAPERPDARGMRAQAARTYADHLYRLATNFALEGRQGAALVALVRLDELQPRYKDTPRRISALRNRLRHQSRFSVELRPLVAPASAAAVAKEIQSRFRTLDAPAGCPDLVVETTALEGPGLAMGGVVEQFYFQSERTTRREPRSFVTGTKRVPNPVRPRLKAKIAQLEAELEASIMQVKAQMDDVSRRETALVEAAPDADLSRLRAEVSAAQSTLAGATRAARTTARTIKRGKRGLRDMPKTVEKPIEKTVQLEIVDETRIATLRLRVDATDLASGERVWDGRVLEAIASTRDTYHRALPRAGIDEDPLSFPKNDLELSEEVVEMITAQLAAPLGELCARQGIALEEKARLASESGDIGAATEAYVQALLYQRGKPPDDAIRFFAAQWNLTDLSRITGLRPES